MKRADRKKVAFVVLAAVALLSCLLVSKILAASNAITVRAGNLVIHAEGTISPSALPKDRMAPISAHVRGKITTVDGSHVPAAKTVHLLVDRHFKIDTTGLPICTVGKIEASPPSEAMKACGAALVGKGSGSAEVEFPESSPFSAKGPLLSFNGPTVGGYPEMIWYVYVDVPVPTALVWVAKLSKESGRYRYKISQTIPKLAGGSGSISAFEVTLGRHWTYKGRQHSYLNAECPNGIFSDQFEALFSDGTNLHGTVVNSCQPKG